MFLFSRDNIRELKADIRELQRDVNEIKRTIPALG